jgi:hypothetical protein
VRRQRQDFHHKTALALLRQYDTIYVEAIWPANLSGASGKSVANLAERPCAAAYLV